MMDLACATTPADLSEKVLEIAGGNQQVLDGMKR